jgi:hypothetical protein
MGDTLVVRAPAGIGLGGKRGSPAGRSQWLEIKYFSL